jgi:DNA-binding MarR family transcriptional regulator
MAQGKKNIKTTVIGSEESIGRWISILHRYGKIYLDKNLEPYSIGSGQFSFLLALYRKDGVSQDILSKELNVDKATTTRAITKLEKEGYVEREVDSSDRRSYKVYLTPEGFLLKNEMRKISQRWTKILMKHFSNEEQESLKDYLKRMSIVASDHHENRK